MPTKTIPNLIRVHYSPGETGWAQDLGGYPQHVKLANCPIGNDLRLHDVCSVVMSDGWLTVNKVLSREFPHSATLWYSDTKYWYILSGAVCIKNWSLEGGLGPRNGKEGFGILNYKGKKTALSSFLKKLNIDDKVRVTYKAESSVLGLPLAMF